MNLVPKSASALFGQHLLGFGQGPQVQDVGNELQQQRNDRKDGIDGGTVLDLEDIDDKLEDRGGAEGAFQQGAGLQRQRFGRGIRILVRQVGNSGQDIVGSEQAEDRNRDIHPLDQDLIGAPDCADRAGDDPQDGHKQGDPEAGIITAGVDQADQVQDECDQGNHGCKDPKNRNGRFGSFVDNDFLFTHKGTVRGNHENQDNPDDRGEQHQQLCQPDLFDSTECVWKPHVFSFFLILDYIEGLKP